MRSKTMTSDRYRSSVEREKSTFAERVFGKSQELVDLSRVCGFGPAISSRTVATLVGLTTTFFACNHAPELAREERGTNEQKQVQIWESPPIGYSRMGKDFLSNVDLVDGTKKSFLFLQIREISQGGQAWNKNSERFPPLPKQGRIYHK